MKRKPNSEQRAASSEFGRALGALLARRGLTAYRLGKMIDRNVTFTRQLETGKRRPSFTTLSEIAAALHLKARDRMKLLVAVLRDAEVTQ